MIKRKSIIILGIALFISNTGFASGTMNNSGDIHHFIKRSTCATSVKQNNPTSINAKTVEAQKEALPEIKSVPKKIDLNLHSTERIQVPEKQEITNKEGLSRDEKIDTILRNNESKMDKNVFDSASNNAIILNRLDLSGTSKKKSKTITGYASDISNAEKEYKNAIKKEK